ncbi:alanine racemase [Amnibacterium kyonggiense]|uniref:Alanine racemase n=1 Tax=Amnibacterium kyonggiense TaxID=595671 RepID=A0A4R7FS38_9MICO|nr:alanine racemase [Amnibacterium kyonggiense]TDS80558.1 alanine racemase [Amnibacterium kyonggiense]
MSALVAAQPVDRPAPRPELRVDTTAIAANVRAAATSSGVAVMAVVKADGFGAGAVPAARAALAAGATWLGTATLDEAVALRRAGLAAPLLCWLLPIDARWEAALRLRIDLAVASHAHLRAITRAARRAGVRARVHLHVDTGMARDGAPLGAWPALVAGAAAAERAGLVEVVGVMGHLARADEPADPSNAAGVRTYRSALDAALAAGLRPTVRHLAATEAALRLPAAAFDLVRIGAGLVGIGPGLRPALTLTAPVVLTRRVEAGTPIGYGHTATTERATTLALLPLGYADGLPRRIDPRAEVLLGGRRCRVLGRVSMDQAVVDAGPRGVRPGAVATVFGPGDDGEPTAADWASWAGTIEHDVVTGIGARVARVVDGRA